jgi:isopenicillin-N N-acyltransferase-like protein
MASLLCLLLLLSAAAAPRGTAQLPSSCAGRLNELPIADGPPRTVAKVKNGERLVAGEAGSEIPVVHVSGTAFEMGEAHGKLMAKELKEFLPLVDAYLKAALPSAQIPPLFADAFATGGVAACLDQVFNLTQPFIPSYFLEEQRGLAAGSGLAEQEFRRFSMMGELTKMGCTMLGAWGPATSKGPTNGGLLQLRALDWDTDGPFQAFPLLLVRHPSNAEEGHAYATVGYPGMVGSITGYSAADLAISEKVWLHYKGSSTYEGTPTTFVLREILQFATSLSDAQSRVKEAARTNSIFIGVGSKQDGEFEAMEYAHDDVTVWTDQTGPEYGNHSRLNGLIYIDKHTQPDTGDGEWCLDALMKDLYGTLTPTDLVRTVAALYQTGDAHVAVYYFDHAEMLVSYGERVPTNQR